MDMEKITSKSNNTNFIFRKIAVNYLGENRNIVLFVNDKAKKKISVKLL
jgi:hypothetical protein